LLAGGHPPPPVAAACRRWPISAIWSPSCTRSGPGESSRHRESYRSSRVTDRGRVEALHSGGGTGPGHSGEEGVLAQRERGREKGHGVILTTRGCYDDDWRLKIGGAVVKSWRRKVDRRRSRAALMEEGDAEVAGPSGSRGSIREAPAEVVRGLGRHKTHRRRGIARRRAYRGRSNGGGAFQSEQRRTVQRLGCAWGSCCSLEIGPRSAGG
jgi:hypothetical protein